MHPVVAALAHLETLPQLYIKVQSQDALHALPSATRTCGVLAVLGLYRECLQSLPLPAVRDEGAPSSSTGQQQQQQRL